MYASSSSSSSTFSLMSSLEPLNLDSSIDFQDSGIDWIDQLIQNDIAVEHYDNKKNYDSVIDTKCNPNISPTPIGPRNTIKIVKNPPIIPSFHNTTTLKSNDFEELQKLFSSLSSFDFEFDDEESEEEDDEEEGLQGTQTKVQVESFHPQVQSFNKAMVATTHQSKTIYQNHDGPYSNNFEAKKPSPMATTTSNSDTTKSNNVCTTPQDQKNTTLVANFKRKMTSSSPATTSTPPLATIAREENWNRRYQELIQFKQQFGDCQVPYHFQQNIALALWVKRQRHQYKCFQQGKNSTMTMDRIHSLEKIGFVWDPQTSGWEERYNQLLEYKEKYGHTNVPCTYKENPKLSIWVKCQRRQWTLYQRNKKSSMTPERILRLNQIGFVWNPSKKR